MSDFWIAFLGGLASGIVLIVLTILIRRLFQKRSEGAPIKLTKEEFRPLLVIAIALTLIFVDVFLIDNGGYLIGVGAFILVFGVITFLS